MKAKSNQTKTVVVNLPDPDPELLYTGFRWGMKKAALDKIRELVALYSITMKRVNPLTGRFYADWTKNYIQVPPLVFVIDMMTTFHEIGHIICPPSLFDISVAANEYRAEMFAIRTAKGLGFDTDAYERQARQHLFFYLHIEFGTGIRWEGMESDTQLAAIWVGLDANKWDSALVITSPEVNVEHLQHQLEVSRAS